jgi:uroporphyrin-III C-methyltransferase
LAQLNHTLVFYMGLTRAGDITRELLNAGMSATTPVAIIENGCRKNQRNIITELHDLSDAVLREQVQSPALIIVGQVVNLKAELELVVERQVMSLSA